MGAQRYLLNKKNFFFLNVTHGGSNWNSVISRRLGHIWKSTCAMWNAKWNNTQELLEGNDKENKM